MKEYYMEYEEEITFNVDGEKLTSNKFVIDVLPKELLVYNDKELIKEIIE